MVHGKGGKKRVVPISDRLAETIRQAPGPHARNAQSRLAVRGRFRRPPDPGMVGTIVATVLPAGYTMHTLRHRFASCAYRGTRNLRAVQTYSGTPRSRPPSDTPQSTTTRSVQPCWQRYEWPAA
jgi:integrase/recombinase XerC